MHPHSLPAEEQPTLPPAPVDPDATVAPRSPEATASLAPQGASPPTLPPSGGASFPALQEKAGALAEAVPGYEILGELGRGGMGVVYKARQTGLGRVVALKMILSGSHAGQDQVARFKREAEAIARLQHPNIVQVHEVGESDGRPFFSLEFCEGGSLDKKTAGSPLPPEQAARLTESLALAIGAAHQANVIHRDLKPANVLLSGDGTPKVTDFGLAKKLDEAGQTQTGEVMGTPSYMAPEQAEGKKEIGPAADVYALGAILYDLLTGRPPFKAATTLDTLMQVVADEPVPPRQLNAKVPRDLETVCLKCLRKDPRQRYASAEELAEDLGRWQRGEPVKARPLGRIARVVKWARRRPAVAGLLAAIVVLTLGALTTITGLYRNAVAEGKRAREQEGIAKTEKERAEKQLERSERLLYASQIQAAQREWEVGNVARAWEHLDSCRWDYRGIEHRYLYTLFNHNHVTFRGHAGPVTSVAVSSNGELIASGSQDNTVKVWDARTGQELRTLKGHTNPVTSVVFSSDGGRIVSSSEFGPVKVHDARTGKELLTLTGTYTGTSGTVSSLAVSSDGGCVVIGSQDGTVTVWDARAGKKLLTFKGHPSRVMIRMWVSPSSVNSVAISGNGGLIASGSWDNTVKVWDARTGKKVHTLNGHTGAVTSVAISGDGGLIASGSQDKTVKVWDARTGKELRTLNGHTGSVHGVAISGDGGLIASGSQDWTVKVWDGRSGKVLHTLTGHTGAVRSVAVSGDGRLIASGGDITVRVWDGNRDKELRTLTGHTALVTSAAVSADGGLIASGSQDCTVKVWDARTDKVLHTLKGHTGSVHGVAVSSNGELIASGSQDRTVKVWDARTGKELRTLKGHTSPVTSVVFSSDGGRIVSGSVDGRVKVHDARTGKELLTLTRTYGAVRSVAVSSDGGFITSVSRDGTVTVWEARTGKEVLLLTGLTGTAATSVAISGGGRLVASGDSHGTVRVWDRRRGEGLLTLKGHAGLVNGLAISGDLGRIVSTGLAGVGLGKAGEVKVWDVHSGLELLTLKGTTGGVTSVAISGDGGCIVSGSDDKTVRVWDARLAQDLVLLKGGTGPLHEVALSADGKRILGRGAAGTVLAWDSRSGQPLPDVPDWIPAFDREALSPDGRLHVRIEGGQIRWAWDARLAQDLPRHKGGSAPREVALSADGKLILGRNSFGTVLAWDSRSGQPLPDVPDWIPAFGREARSADGRLHLRIEGGQIRVRRADLEENRKLREQRDRAFLERLARFDPDWDQRKVDEALAAGDDVGAAFHLERLARHQPWDATLHVHCAHVLARLSRREESVLQLAQALMLNPRVSLWPIDPEAAQRGEKAAAAGDWPRAVRELQVAARQPQAPATVLRRLIWAQVAAEDREGIRQTMEVIARRLPSEKDPTVVWALIDSALCVPWEASEAEVLLAHARWYVERNRNAGSLELLGNSLYRAGKYSEAAETLAKSVRVHGQGGFPAGWLFQAKLAERDGKHEEAVRLLKRVEEWCLKQYFTDWGPPVWWEAQLREARQLINASPAKPPRIEKK
jgi:WD40 repeat protein/tetratricopeptide (TPR) repeat protein